MPSNLIGGEVRKIRVSKGMSQQELAGLCQLKGFDISRSTLSKIEAQIRNVSDSELLQLADILEVGLKDLYPKSKKR